MSRTAADILAGGSNPDAPAIDQYVGQLLTITSVRREDGSFGEYLVLEGVDADGNDVAVPTGSGVIKEQVEELEAIGAFPLDTVIEKGLSKAGRKYYRLGQG